MLRTTVMKITWYAPLLLALVGGSQAQEPLVSQDTPVNSTILHQWLHSGDPRLIAWAADFARRNHDEQLLGDMPGLLERWRAEPAQHPAMVAMLDALIQDDFQVSVRDIQTIVLSFPAQAVILIGRHPLSESRITLEEWARGTTGDFWSAQMLARVASMMLAKDPESSRTSLGFETVSFVAGVVASSENHLNISISAAQSGVGGGVGSGSCGDSVGRSAAPGWPDVYFYYLEEHYQRGKGNEDVSNPILVDLDGDQIVSRRLKEGQGWGSCFGVEPLDPSTRHQLIAYWLGVHDHDMAWHVVDSVTIVWTNESAYKRQLGTIVESQRRKLRDTVDQLKARGLLNEDEASRIMPKLVVTIQCDIKPCPL